MLQALQSAGQKQCIQVERSHEGASTLGDNSIYFIGVLGKFKQHDDDNDDDDSDDNTGQFWNSDPGSLMARVHHYSPLSSCMDSTCQAGFTSVKSS